MDILIVEDDFIIQMFLENIVKQSNNNVIGTVDTYDKALELLQNKTPDLILMDITINGTKDGIELTEKINELYSLPVVYMTGNSDLSTIKRAELTNPLQILFKPIDEDNLKKELKNIQSKLNK